MSKRKRVDVLCLGCRSEWGHNETQAPGIGKDCPMPRCACVASIAAIASVRPRPQVEQLIAEKAELERQLARAQELLEQARSTSDRFQARALKAERGAVL